MNHYEVIQFTLNTNAAGASPPTLAVLLGLFSLGTLTMALIRHDIRRRSAQRRT